MQEFILNQVSSYKCKKYNFSVFIEFYRRHNFQDTCGSCGTPPISNCPPPSPFPFPPQDFFWGVREPCVRPWLARHLWTPSQDVLKMLLADAIGRPTEVNWRLKLWGEWDGQLRRKREMPRQRNIRTQTRDRTETEVISNLIPQFMSSDFKQCLTV